LGNNRSNKPPEGGQAVKPARPELLGFFRKGGKADTSVEWDGSNQAAGVNASLFMLVRIVAKSSVKR
jgi:hypothetical protein